MNVFFVSRAFSSLLIFAKSSNLNCLASFDSCSVSAMACFWVVFRANRLFKTVRRHSKNDEVELGELLSQSWSALFSIDVT